MNRKRIIIAHSWTDVSVNIQTKGVAYRLADDGWDVWFLTQARVGAPVTQVSSSLTVIEWPNKRPTTLKDLFFCIKQLLSVKPDAVIVHFGATKVVMLASWLMGVRHRIAWYHTLALQTKLESKGFIRRQFNLQIRTIVYNLATKVVVLNNYAAQDVMKNHHVKQSKVITIENGLNAVAERKPAYDYHDKEISFLFLGRLTHSKGCDVLINAFAKVATSYPATILRFVGEGDNKEQLKQLVNRLHLGRNIIFEGGVKYDNVFGCIESCYALLVPSRIDNFPTVVLEAFSCGVPVIGSKVGGIPEMIEDGVDGFLCESENVDSWAENIIRLIAAPELRNKTAVNARSAFEKRYQMQRHIENVEHFLETLQ